MQSITNELWTGVAKSDKHFVTAAEAITAVKSGDRVFMHGMAGLPQRLADALVDRATELRDVEIVHMHTEGRARYAEAQFADSFFVNNLFIGGNVRSAVDAGRSDYVPVFLSEIPALFRKGILPIDVALITVSPPDRHGYCSLGVSVDTTLAAVQTARTVIAQVNPNVTEYGIADLYGKNLRQRATALIKIAHPACREELERAAYDRFKRA